MQPQQTPTPAPLESGPQQSGQLESLPQPITKERQPSKIEQEAIAGKEQAPSPKGDSANQNAGMPVVTPAPIAPTTPLTTTVSDDDTPPIAADVDLIEKTWVRKAKAVVERNKDDPYNQNKEVNKVKASYIKKRYNKDVKLAE